jgi:pheromone shutdown protein TraB
VVLGDRPVMTTLKRTWGSLSTYEKMKFVAFMFIQSFSDISEEDVEMYVFSK